MTVTSATKYGNLNTRQAYYFLSSTSENRTSSTLSSEEKNLGLVHLRPLPTT